MRQRFSLRWSINSLQEITMKRDHLSPSVVCNRSYSIKGHNWNQKPRWMPRDFPKHQNVSLLYRNIHIIKLFLVRLSQLHCTNQTFQLSMMNFRFYKTSIIFTIIQWSIITVHQIRCHPPSQEMKLGLRSELRCFTSLRKIWKSLQVTISTYMPTPLQFSSYLNRFAFSPTWKSFSYLKNGTLNISSAYLIQYWDHID